MHWDAMRGLSVFLSPAGLTGWLGCNATLKIGPLYLPGLGMSLGMAMHGSLVCCPAGDLTPRGVSITEVSVPGSDSPRIAALHSPAAATASPVVGSSPGAQHASAEERPGAKVRSPGWQPGSPSQQGTLIKVSLGATKAANR